MIASDKRKAVFILHEEGMGIREIARKLNISRKSVKKIIEERGEPLKIQRSDRIEIAPERLEKLYEDCEGFLERVHEKLTEEDKIELGYSTLTRLVRAMGLGESADKDRRDSKVPDVPGQEMQQDTSPYVKPIGGRMMKIVGSLLYLRYCKMRYLKFYPSFNRFQMKCFFHEAVTHFDRVAEKCIIDNTNLAVLYGTGSDAVMVPEMIEFAKSHGDFKWKAHKIKHSDRKGGVESGFWFVETNFFPGRTFESLEDLNQQAFEWATQRIVIKPHAKTGLIPAQLFEFEKPKLKKLPPFVPEPVLAHERETDQYGYAAFDGNFYWIPGNGRGRVQVLQYAEKIRIYRNRELLAEYALPAHGIKHERFRPAGVPAIRQYPNNCKRPTGAEENRLKAIDPAVTSYLEFLSKEPESSQKKYRLTRQLFRLSLKLAPVLFIDTIRRAHRYRIADIETIERIAQQLMRENSFEMESWRDVDGEDDLQDRDIYRDGEVSNPPDMSRYDHLLDADEKNTDDGGDDGQGS